MKFSCTVRSRANDDLYLVLPTSSVARGMAAPCSFVSSFSSSHPPSLPSRPSRVDNVPTILLSGVCPGGSMAQMEKDGKWEDGWMGDTYKTSSHLEHFQDSTRIHRWNVEVGPRSNRCRQEEHQRQNHLHHFFRLN